MRTCLLILAIALVSTFPATPLCAVDPPTLPPPGSLVVAESAGLTFAELATLAGNSHPDIKVARAAVIAAQGRFIQSGLYPNPIIGYYGTDLNTKPNPAGKEGISFNQQIVTANKLGLARAAASKGIAAADWTAVSRYFDVVSRLRVAYYDAVAAQREVTVNEELLVLAGQGLRAAEKLVAAGTGARPDVLRARVDLELFRNRLAIARHRAEATWRLLAVAAGQPQMEWRPLADRLEEEAITYDYAAVEAHILGNSGDIRAALASVAEAEILVRRAQAEVCPNVTLQVVPEYFFDDRRPGGYVTLTAPIPVFNRNQGNILAARAELARTYQVVRQTELLLTQRLALAYQRYRVAQEQMATFSKRILPDAAEALKLIQLGYQRGDARYDYTAVLQAQNALAQSQLGYVGVLNELQRAVSEIEGLLQREDVLGTCTRAGHPAE
jgi:outer membrane protein, heavy metal efflux system